MSEPVASAEEAARLAALARYDILDTPGEAAFDDLTLLAAQMCTVPIALISLLDDKRQWFKSRRGVPIEQLPRSMSFCNLAIQSDQLLEIQDVQNDSRFLANPLMRGQSSIGFYAGTPLITPDGYRLGTLCVIDHQPRQLNAEQRAGLAALSRQAMRQIESRAIARRAQHEAQFQHALLNSAGIAILSMDPAGTITSFNRGAEALLGYAASDLIGQASPTLFHDRAELLVRAAALSRQQHQPVTADADLLLRLSHLPAPEMCEWRYRHKNGAWFPVRLMLSAIRDDHGTLTGCVIVAYDLSEQKKAEQAQDQALDFIRTIASQVPGVIYQFRLRPDGSSCFPYASQRLSEIYQITPDSVADDASDVLNKILAEDLPRVSAAIQLSAHNLTQWQQEYRVRFDDGALRWVEGKAVPQREADGATLWHGVITDITARKLAEVELNRSRAFLQTLIDSLPVLLYTRSMRPGEQGQFVVWNRMAEQITGCSAAALVGQTGHGVLPQELASIYDRQDQQIRATRQPCDINEHTAQRPDGSTCILHTRSLPLFDRSGQIDYVLGISEDITARHLADKARTAIKRRLRLITDNLPAMIGYVNAQARYEFCSVAYHTLLGFDHEAMLGRTVADVYGAVAYANMADKVEAALRGERVSYDRTVLGRNGDVHLQAEYIPDIDDDGKVAGFYSMVTDITARNLIEQKLAASEASLRDNERQLILLARFDSLTGLPNRYQLNEKLAQALKRNNRHDGLLALLFLDVDHFKQINDTWGHAAGDSVLKEFAARLQRSVRTTDIVARLAGDEFVIVLEGLKEADESRLVAAKILELVGQPWSIAGQTLAVKTSIGIALAPAGSQHLPDDLLAVADRSLYDAKAAGRNTYRLTDGD